MSASIRHIGSPLGSRGGIRSVSGFGSGSAAPVKITLTSPNDWSNGAWSHLNATPPSNTATDPFGGSSASQIVASANGFANFFQPTNYSGGSSGVLIGGQDYYIDGYIQTSAAPVWAWVLVQDVGGTGDHWGAWIDTNANAFGSFDSTGTGTLTAHTIATVGGFSHFRLTGKFTGTTTGADVVLIFANADSGATGTSGQAYNVYGWGA